MPYLYVPGVQKSKRLCRYDSKADVVELQQPFWWYWINGEDLRTGEGFDKWMTQLEEKNWFTASHRVQFLYVITKYL